MMKKKRPNLNDANFVGHIKSIIVWGELHISLLLAVRPVEQKINTPICQHTE